MAAVAPAIIHLHFGRGGFLCSGKRESAYWPAPAGNDNLVRSKGWKGYFG
jgi:hypothetical protein